MAAKQGEFQTQDDDSDDYEEISPDEFTRKVPFWKSDQFKDIQPLPLPSDGETSPRFNILYRSTYIEGMQIFYAIQQQQEYSKRALQLTSELILLASSFYTLWEYRWQCLMALDDSLESEWDFCQQVLDESPKNYQLFNHRRKCFEFLFAKGDAEVARKELEFAGVAIQRDAKNYHAWSHRWHILHVSQDQELVEQELKFTEKRLYDDPFNNSAWNQRFSILNQFKSTDVYKELEVALKQAKRAPSNESVWVYIQGLMRYCNYEQQVVDKVVECCKEVLKGDGRYVQATNVLGKLAQITFQDSTACKIYEYLSQIDPIRQGFWKLKQEDIKKQMSLEER
eukprot:TRINITY_DN5299_c1_g1_i1.p1 TRINITY_DN5299_c1_g1~~TRINITY_DN5299_c1_g1_i1.p1  ORF type:complete len:339 (-),score=47.88 TRINITY_DN5299_c1_g1_i1:114-1130(-)